MPIARGLRDAGCEVVLVCPSGPHVDDFRAEGFRWVDWPVRRRSVNPLRELPAVQRLTGVYRRERFDAVHHFTIKPNLYGTIAARRAGVPAVFNMFSGLGHVFSDAPAARALYALLAPVMRRAFDDPRVRMLALNQPDLQRLRAEGLADPDRSRLLPESVDTERFHPSVQREASGPPTVLIACRLVRDKGASELVAAARILRDRGVAARIRIAGEPDHGNPKRVTAEELRSWKREGLVELLGSREDIPELLRATDVAVLPTHYMEGAPRFLMEAAATRLPLVATDIPGCREVVRAQVNGFLVPPRDPHALADALAELLADAELRDRLGAASRRIAEEEWSEHNVVRAHLALYRDAGVFVP